MDLHQKLFLYFSALALLAQCQPAMGDPIKDPQKMEAMHEKMDIDGDGRLSLKEVIEFNDLTFKDMAAKASADMEKDGYDTDKDGKVSFEELWNVFQEDFDHQFEGFDIQDKAKTAHEEHQKREKQHTKERFEAADTNKDGKLDKNEFGHFEHPQASPDVLKALVKARVKRKDQDGDGKLDSKEYFADEDMTGYDGNEEKIKKAFSRIDVDGDGKLSEEELYMQETGEHHVLSAFKALLADADTDKDSHLSLDEFLKHMPLIADHKAAGYIHDWMLHHEIEARGDEL